MNRKSFLGIVGLILILGLVAWAQAGGLEGLIQAIQNLLGEKQGQTFLDLLPSEGKALETQAAQEFAEIEEGAALPEEPLLSALTAGLIEKSLTIEQSFLLPPKETSPVGNEFQEEPKD